MLEQSSVIIRRETVARTTSDCLAPSCLPSIDKGRGKGGGGGTAYIDEEALPGVPRPAASSLGMTERRSEGKKGFLLGFAIRGRRRGRAIALSFSLSLSL
ncbi:unnamed protein product [Musa acuminata subsp. burmannicoides]